MNLTDKDALEDAVQGAINIMEAQGISMIAASVPLAIIKGASTIDAIPVEWLKEQADYRRSEWDYDTCEGIRIVLKAWEEEQEAKT